MYQAIYTPLPGNKAVSPLSQQSLVMYCFIQPHCFPVDVLVAQIVRHAYMYRPTCNFRVRGATYISVGHNVFWSDKAYRGHTNITVDKLIEYIQFLINSIRCLSLKSSYLSHILPILTNWEMYTP